MYVGGRWGCHFRDRIQCLYHGGAQFYIGAGGFALFVDYGCLTLAYIPSKMYRSYISEVSSVSVYNIFPLAFKANYIFFSNFKVNESKRVGLCLNESTGWSCCEGPGQSGLV